MSLKPIPKEVTFLAKNLNHGGAEKVCVTLVNSLIESGYKINLILINLESTILYNQLNKNTNVTVLNGKDVKSSSIKLYRLIRILKPSLILSFHIEPALLVSILRPFFQFKFKLILRSINTLSIAYNDSNRFIDKYFVFPLLKRHLKKMDLVIAQSTGMKNDLVGKYFLHENKIKTIFNPAFVNKKEFDLSEKETNNKTKFLFIGRLEPQKGLFDLITIFKEAINLNPEITLNILGDGSLKDELIANIDSLNLTDKIKLSGFDPDITKHIQSSSAVVLASYYEGFPNVLVESITLGTPVISYDCPSGPNDIIIENINGILIPHLNKKEFTKAVLKVANKEVTFKKSKIMESSKRFDLDKITYNYIQVFNKYLLN